MVCCLFEETNVCTHATRRRRRVELPLALQSKHHQAMAEKEINASQATSSRGEVENLVLVFKAARAEDAKLKDRDSARTRKPGVQFADEIDEATYRED